MTDTHEEGLRARKRRATREAIERAAVELSLEHGYEHVTVEMICEVADISQRTFFNYAGSKEGAVLGIEPPLPDQELRAAYVAGRGSDPLEDLLATLAEAFARMGGAAPELFRKRRRVIESHPALALKEFARMEEAQSTVVELVRERLEEDDAGAAPGGAPSPGRVAGERSLDARMTVSLAFGVMHFAAASWLDEGLPPDPGPFLAAALERARRLTGR
ncbi:TetR/AcrR family transcriptional regulator [Zafaria sp. J156]|uniref:TetR/AcrR family transcriptional regulator n=1 Tax=Zafaria sp. J156 TaxID=3116490 RepID=UPI002E77DB3E|nr:TetR/AcrR family transcriptional regulator [Zafaria sp. J156]MEE1622385.1 TetR/AcrR family transcriptional regulator [Zafaria sp. J156]